MPYLEYADLQARIPAPFLLEALDDNRDGSVDAWEGVQATACNDVDAILSARFATPFVAPLPPIVVRAAQVFACELCYSRRGVAADANPWTSQADELRARLAAIAAGSQPLLPEADRVQPSGTVIGEPAKFTSSTGRTL